MPLPQPVVESEHLGGGPVILRLDKLGVVVVILVLYGAISPFATLKANRIVQGESFLLLASLPAWIGWFLLAVLAGTATLALVKTSAVMRLLAAAFALIVLLLCIGRAGADLLPADNSYARVSPASGFWVLLFTFALLAADAIARLQPSPLKRLFALAVAIAVVAVVLLLGVWDSLSIMQEYAARSDVFWTEAVRHLVLALGSLLAATIVGLPLGVFAWRVPGFRAGVLNSLNLVQTIPSIALFGILIAPLAWIAVNIPGARAIGISGIGAPPAFVALFLYSLLPVVANTVAGLDSVPRAAREAARGLGMTSRQRLFRIEFPIAMPMILTAIRIVLVQNVGLATIAALIGGGGFGTFVFQGLGQTATDLVLLGALPTVALAFIFAVSLDAVIELNGPTRDARRRKP